MPNIIEIIQQMPEGKRYGVGLKKEDACRFGFRCFIRRKDAGYEVEAAWMVPESYDDDPESYTGNPFGVGASFAWTAQQAADAAEAATLYERAIGQLKSRQPVRWS